MPETAVNLLLAISRLFLTSGPPVMLFTDVLNNFF